MLLEETCFYSFTTVFVFNQLIFVEKLLSGLNFDRRDGVVVRESASQSVDLGFIPLVVSYQTTKNGIHSFLAWRSAFRGGGGGQARKFACCVHGQSSEQDAPTFM